MNNVLVKIKDEITRELWYNYFHTLPSHNPSVFFHTARAQDVYVGSCYESILGKSYLVLSDILSEMNTDLLYLFKLMPETFKLAKRA